MSWPGANTEKSVPVSVVLVLVASERASGVKPVPDLQHADEDQWRPLTGASEGRME